MKTKTMDDWDELAEALSEALPCGVEVDFPGKDDEDTDLRLIPGDGGTARLVIDLGDEDTASSGVATRARTSTTPTFSGGRRTGPAPASGGPAARRRWTRP